MNHMGFDRDYLKDLGGEAEAVLKDGMVVKYVDEKGKEWVGDTHVVKLGQGEDIDLTQFEEQSDYKVAYAYCELEAEEAGKVYALFGSDDRVKVWVNGEQVHEYRVDGRGVNLGDDLFGFDVHKGKNKVLVKVENGVRGWGFVCKLIKQSEYDAIQAKKALWEKTERFAYTQITRKTNNNQKYAFWVGAFPELDFENPELAREMLGEYTIDVQWFDVNGERVERADKPGRYGAVIKATGEDGTEVHRGYTFFAFRYEYDMSRVVEDVDVSYLIDLELDKDVWADQQEEINKSFYYGVRDYQYSHPYGSGALAALFERAIELKEGKVEQPRWMNLDIRNQEYLLGIRMKAEGLEPVGELAYPKVVKGQAAPIVRAGSLKEAGFKEGFRDAMDDLCKRWIGESGLPFTVSVVRNGVIAFDDWYDRPGTDGIGYHGYEYEKWDEQAGYAGQDYIKGYEARHYGEGYDIASVSKILFSTMLSMARYQGIVDLDEPVGKYLKRFPVEGEKAFTLRMCMQHMTGWMGM